MFIISIDVDVGSRTLGVINKGLNDANVGRHTSECCLGQIEETAIPLFIKTFSHFEIPVTFAVRGQLTEADDSVLEMLLESSVKHDIGAHGYYHRNFQGLSRNEARHELNLISTGMKKFGVMPKTFVFPRNGVAFLDLLEKYGYKCFRSQGDFLKDCMYIEKQGALYDVHPSLYLDQSINAALLKKIADLAIAKRLPFHVWFHLWNFGDTGTSIQRSLRTILCPFFDHAKKKEKSGDLTFETMLSAAKRIEEDAL